MSHGFLMVVAERLGIAESIDFICTNTMTLASVETDTYDLVYTSNGVHVWINDLNAMYENIRRVLKPNGISIMFDIHPLQIPFDEQMKIYKAYDYTGPFEDETSVTFHWRIQDMINAILDSGLLLRHIAEYLDEKNYNHPFWLKLEDVVNGVTVSKEEVDRMYSIEYNPSIALPGWLC